jgi:hypothetical protein
MKKKTLRIYRTYNKSKLKKYKKNKRITKKSNIRSNKQYGGNDIEFINIIKHILPKIETIFTSDLDIKTFFDKIKQKYIKDFTPKIYKQKYEKKLDEKNKIFLSSNNYLNSGKENIYDNNLRLIHSINIGLGNEENINIIKKEKSELGDENRLDKIFKYVETKKVDLFMKNDINYPIDDDKIKKWINLQCSRKAKDLAELIYRCTRYVSFKEFIDKLYKSFDLFLDKHKDKNYIIILTNEKTKSNYWVALLILLYIAKENKKRPINVLKYASDALFIYNKEESEKFIYVFFDDASYSGNQICQNFDFYTKRGINDYIFNESTFNESDKVVHKNFNIKKNLYAVVPFISTNAEAKIKKESRENYIIYVDKFKNIDCKDKKIFNIDGEQIDITKDEDLLKLEKLYNENIKYEYSLRLTNNCFIYFDHKLADYMSSLPEIYGTGLIKKFEGIFDDFKKNITDEVYDLNCKNTIHKCSQKSIEYFPFIKNCDKCTTFKNIDNDEQDNLCIKAFYKTLKLDEENPFE